MNSYELYHYGVKGMKWGVRKTPERLGRRTARKKQAGGKREAIEKSRKKRQWATALTASVLVAMGVGSMATLYAADRENKRYWAEVAKDMERLFRNTTIKDAVNSEMFKNGVWQGEVAYKIIKDEPISNITSLVIR